MRTALHEQYSTALREYCAKGTEAALSWDFQPSVLGQRAVREGLGVLEMAAMHQKALVETLLEMLAVDDTTRITHRASEFVAEALAEVYQGNKPVAEDPYSRLTDREREVYQLVVEGNTNAQVADVLCISSKTVDNHRTHLMEKLGVHNTVELLRFAAKHGHLS